ncbi:probable riboflavin biosynthesis protein Rib7 [Rhynchosporium secalis]|uniref:2,5-diamino-6-ribosylamino-4(3H)-pyrimidinone 5'-phosphate reductase n=1 Tax=Rhynchosporium secalis TaxID=38038 RepID=A0A1E1LUR1_RHYSE|nr:probable riboflavin biosynthesis protein Rib7 [Rhynchosporium secalis]
MATIPKDTLQFPAESRKFLDSYLPPAGQSLSNQSLYPFTTITFATSLDSQLSLSPGTQTVLSGRQSKAMTHYLRSRHDAILIGVGTAIADNPGLNCRIEGVGGYGSAGLEGQPRPIIIDPHARWEFTEENKIFQLARDGKGRTPYIITTLVNPPAERAALLNRAGGKYITLVPTDSSSKKLDWKDILKALMAERLNSIMIEGGAGVINALLAPEYFSVISSVIITIAPVWLGEGGVAVLPPRQNHGTAVPVARLRHVKWHPFGEDVVLCGNFEE